MITSKGDDECWGCGRRTVLGVCLGPHRSWQYMSGKFPYCDNVIEKGEAK